MICFLWSFLQVLWTLPSCSVNASEALWESHMLLVGMMTYGLQIGSPLRSAQQRLTWKPLVAAGSGGVNKGGYNTSKMRASYMTGHKHNLMSGMILGFPEQQKPWRCNSLNNIEINSNQGWWSLYIHYSKKYDYNKNNKLDLYCDCQKRAEGSLFLYIYIYKYPIGPTLFAAVALMFYVFTTAAQCVRDQLKINYTVLLLDYKGTCPPLQSVSHSVHLILSGQ